MLDDNDPDIIPPCPFAVGDQFETLSALKSAAREYAIRTFFEFTTVRASKTRWRIACKAEGCHWGLYATSIAGANNIFASKHCIRTMIVSEWITEVIVKQTRSLLRSGSSIKSKVTLGTVLKTL